MSDQHEEEIRRIIQGDTEQGLTLTQRTQIRTAVKHIVQIVGRDISDPRVAFTALVSALGGLIAAEFPENEHQYRLNLVATSLPLYVNVYKQKERQL